MKKTLILMAIAASTLACTKHQTIGINLENLDTTVVAQNDFYHYACGGWMVNHPLTAEYSRFGSFDLLAENNREQLNGLLSEIAAKKHPKGSIEQKIADLYNLQLDTARRNVEGLSVPCKTLAQIDAINSVDELTTFLAQSLDCGLWGLYVDADAKNSAMNILWEYQGGFTLGEKEYYTDNDENTLHIRNEYEKHVARMFTLFGFENGQELAATVLRLETRLAVAAFNNVELRDPVANYNMMSIDDLQELVPEVKWKCFLTEAEIAVDSISIGQIRHLQEAGKMLVEEPLEDLKTLFKWQVIDNAAGALTDEIYMANFDFYGKVLSGKEEPSPLWKRAVNTVNGVLGEPVGQMYVKKYFPAEAKERMEKLVKNLQIALGQRIDAQEWMSDETKAKAHEKLDAFYVKVGYPNKWRDYSGLDIDPTLTFYENLKRAEKFERDYEMSFVEKPVDRDKWYMTPQTVNAYYNPSTNEICFPAGILQYPFFDMNADDAFNYGAIGVVIGHEMTHGFDDMGSQFDKDGNLNDWWTAEDKERFKARTQVMVDYFNGIEVAPGVFANGEFTLGENIADHGGLNISFQAFKNAQVEKSQDEQLTTENGLTPEQRFFIAFANVWAGNIRDEEILNRTKSDPHSLALWRVNGALPHINAWYEAWNVTEESPMYVKPENRVDIW